MGIIACVVVTTTTVGTTTITSPITTAIPSTTTGPISTTALLATGTLTTPITTTTLAPTTTTMNYCAEENGMNQPLTIQPNQVTSNQPYDQTTPSTGSINPTTSTPGLNFPSTSPLINITLAQPAALTVVYIPTDRPIQTTNVQQFALIFAYPDGTRSEQYTSQTPSATGTTTTTTPATGTPSGTTPSDVVPPSDVSPQVDLPANFQVPSGTVLMIVITATENSETPRGVSIHTPSLTSRHHMCYYPFLMIGHCGYHRMR